MTDGESVLRKLSDCGKMMSAGQFTKHDLDFIKQMLEALLRASEKVVKVKSG